MLFTPPDPTPSRPARRARASSPGASGSRCTRPGHTLDHLCLYDPEHGILLSGDHVLPSITPHVSGVGQRRRRAPQSTSPTLDLVADARRRAARPARARPSVRRRARARRGDQGAPPGAHGAARATASVALGPASVQQLSHELFPKKHWGVMAESETFAHLEHLVARGQAERCDDDGTLIYTVAPAVLTAPRVAVVATTSRRPHRRGDRPPPAT